MNYDHPAEFVIPRELDGRPLDGAVRLLLGSSWSQARRLIQTGKILLGGRPATSITATVRQGDSLSLVPAARKPGRVRLDAELIVFVDPHIVVVRKPADVSTVPYEEKERGTLDQMVSSLLHRRHAGKGPAPQLGVVQRLDKATSGLIVFARTWRAKQALALQFRHHTALRRYVAIAHGRVQASTYKSHLVSNRGDRLRGSSQLRQIGQLAVTHVEPLEQLPQATLILCRLETGRTHQIRIHLSEAGHPLLGERVYIRNYAAPLLDAPRLMLHARDLGFVHPSTGQSMSFSDPPPADFAQVLARLRAKLPDEAVSSAPRPK